MASLSRIIVYLDVVYIVLLAHMTNGEKYSSIYDDIDIDAILANPRLRNQYVKCIINTAPCITGSARFLKEKFAEAFITKCKRCTEKQVIFFDKITEWFTINEPETWDRAVQLALEEIQKKNE